MKVFLVFVQSHFLQLLRQKGPLFAAAGVFVVTLVAIMVAGSSLLTPSFSLLYALFMAVCLSIMLYLDDDMHDGTLEVLLMQHRSLFAVMLAKIVVQWAMLMGLILLIVITWYGAIGMPLMVLWESALLLTLSGLAMVSLGVVVAAATVRFARRHALAYCALLLLCLPIIIQAPVIWYGVADDIPSRQALVMVALALPPLCAWIGAVIAQRVIRGGLV